MQKNIHFVVLGCLIERELDLSLKLLVYARIFQNIGYTARLLHFTKCKLGGAAS